MKFRYLVCIFLIALFMQSCKTTQHAAGKKALSENERVNVTYTFFNANKEKMLGNYEMSANLFSQCVHMDPANDAAFYGLAQVSDKLGRLSDALFFARSAVRLKPDNTWYQLELADLLQRNTLFNEAVEVYEKLVKANPDRVDFYFELANALVYAGKLTESIKVYDKLEQQVGLNPEISEQKEKLYVKLGKIDKAVEEVRKLTTAFPKEVRYYMMLAELYQANNMMDKTMEVLKEVQQFDADNPYVHLSFADYYRSTGNKSQSFEELKRAFASKRLDMETKVNILSSYYVLMEKYPEMKDQSMELNKILVETHPSEPRAFAVYGDFLYHDKKLEDARSNYRKSIELDKQTFLVWQQLLFVESELADYASLLKESEEAITLFPSQPLVYFFNGMANIQMKKYEEALKVLEPGSKLVVDNKPLLGQFYASIGDANYRLKKMPESDKAFDMALELEPKNTFVLNNYGYYLSLRKDSLEKAERMSLLSNQLDTNNSSFEDTYAWILYQMGRYGEAKTWLEKAMKNGAGGSAVIIEHYADVLYQLGDRDKAVEEWEKAKRAGTGSEFLDRKINEKKLIE